MISRRRFLQTGSLAAGFSVALPTLATRPKLISLSRQQSPRSHSPRGEAKPITIEERATRQEKTRRLMRENNLSAILLTPAHPLPTLPAYAGRVESASLPWCYPPRAKRLCFSRVRGRPSARTDRPIARWRQARPPRPGRKTRAPTPASRKDSVTRISSGTIGLEETGKICSQ